MESGIDKFVKCPFYIKTAPNKIVCDSYIKRAKIHLVFEDDKDRHKYMKGVCNGIESCEICPIYQMLNAMFEVIENE